MTIRIMPLGDSLTWGANADDPLNLSGYRRPLWELMDAAGWDTDIVGTLTAGPAGPWDHDHEGHGGYRADEIEAGFAGWYATNRADVVLLLIGINDILQGQAALLPGRWASLFTTMHTAAPGTLVLVSPLTPAFTTTAFPVATLAADVVAANALLPGIVATAQAAGCRIELVHVGDVVSDPAGISSDGVHPSASGYAQMADAWYSYLVDYMALLTPPTALPGAVEVEVAVSWDGSGAFDGPDDDVTAAVAIDPGVAVRHGRQDSLSLSPPRISDGGVDLHNDDGTYSQERPDSPVYQRVIPGRPVRYRAGHGQRRVYRSHTTYRSHQFYRGQATWELGRHVIRDIGQTVEWGNRFVKLDTIGYETILTRATVSVAVMVAPRVDQCVTALLDAAGWPSDARDISVSDTTLLYWWCDERHPWDAMLELLAAEGPGTFYVDRSGVFHFENRNYRTTATRATTSQASFFDRDDSARTAYRDHVLYRDHRLYRGRTGGLWFTGFQYDPAFRNIVNRATYTTRRRTLGSLAAVWSYGTSFDLTALQSRTLIARPTTPFQNAVTPALTTDYTVAGGTVSVSLSATSGLVAFITVTATSGTPTVSGLQLRAKPLTVVSETTVENSVDASESIAKFSPIPGEDVPITLPVAGWAEIDPPNAEAVCDAWVNRYQEPRPVVTVTVRNADAAHVRQILDRMPSDRITLSETNTGLSSDLWINSTQLRIAGAHGTVVEAVLGCETTNELTGGIWDLSLWDDPAAVWGV